MKSANVLVQPHILFLSYKAQFSPTKQACVREQTPAKQASSNTPLMTVYMRNKRKLDNPLFDYKLLHWLLLMDSYDCVSNEDGWRMQ